MAQITTTPQWRRAVRALAPDRTLVTAAEVSHPLLSERLRVINEARDQTVGGNVYQALRFGLRLAADVDGRPPRGEVWIDNVGRAVTRWIEDAGGGVGATVRLMSLSRDGTTGAYDIEWSHDLAVVSVRIDNTRVSAVLGATSLRGRAAVAVRHDPSHSPGLF